MKKIYFVDEEEKRRILSIHESETKRKFLSEAPQIDAAAYAWNKYPCVVELAKTKGVSIKTKDNSYLIDDFRYFPNGRKGNVKTKAMGNFTCNDPEFKTNTPTGDKTKQQQYNQQIVTNTSNTTKKIQELLGLKQTGIMDSLLLQKINEKLNGTVQQTPATNASSVPSENTQPEVKSVTKSLPPVNPSNTAAQIQSMVKDFSPTQAKTAPSREEAIANAKAALERARKLK
jgi:hypothetical protein